LKNAIFDKKKGQIKDFFALNYLLLLKCLLEEISELYAATMVVLDEPCSLTMVNHDGPFHSQFDHDQPCAI